MVRPRTPTSLNEAEVTMQHNSGQMNNGLLFVLAVLDNGYERNFVTREVRLVGDSLVALVGKASQFFKIDDVIDLVLVDLATDRTLSAERRCPRLRQCQPPSDL